MLRKSCPGGLLRPRGMTLIEILIVIVVIGVLAGLALPVFARARERAIQADLARQSGKLENVIEKMLEGRMRKFYEDTVLLSQTFVIDGETQVGKVLEKASKEFGTPVEITGFVRFQVGEGIDKMTGDFADEVGKLAGH